MNTEPSSHVPQTPLPTERILTPEDMRCALHGVRRSGISSCFVFTEVDLCGLGLTDISLLLDYRHLEVVRLAGNRLGSEAVLPLLRLPNLVSVDLSDNRLETFGGHPAADSASTPTLKSLNLSRNRLHEAPDLAAFPFLRHLDLSHNSLACVQRTLEHLPRLRTLDVSHNFLRAVPRGPSLTHLDVSSNKIETLHVQSTLTYLDARDNAISRIDKVEPCSALLFADISHNELHGATAVASAFRCCKCLRELRVEGLRPGKDEQPDMLDDELEAADLARDNRYEPPTIACQSLPTIEQLDRMRDKAKSLSRKDLDVVRAAVTVELPQLTRISGRQVTVEDAVESLCWGRPDALPGLAVTSIFH